MSKLTRVLVGLLIAALAVVLGPVSAAHADSNFKAASNYKQASNYKKAAETPRTVKFMHSAGSDADAITIYQYGPPQYVGYVLRGQTRHLRMASDEPRLAVPSEWCYKVTWNPKGPKKSRSKTYCNHSTATVAMWLPKGSSWYKIRMLAG